MTWAMDWETKNLRLDLEKLIAAGGGGGGGGAQAPYRWSTNTAATDPGSGFAKMNNANTTLATHAYVSKFDINGVLPGAVIALKSGDTMFFYETGVAGTGNKYTAGTMIDNGGWVDIPITFVSAGSVAFAPGPNADIEIAA